MMQEIQEIETKGFGHDSRVSSQSFDVLLALARKSPMSREVPVSFGMNPSEFGQMLDRLCRTRLVGVVSELDERDVRQTLRLTDKGERVLLREMEQMYELPER
jgi:DNA-binding MarR family transcriptional regulator